MGLLQRGYCLVELKSFDDERRVLTGIATTPSTDRVGDIVESTGAKFAPSIPLLLYHDSRLPVGTAKLSPPSRDGITFEASIPRISEPGTLRDRVEEAWQSVKAGLIKGVSIGFRAAQDGIEMLKGGGLKFVDFEILELSLVAVPANQDASITSIKSLCAAVSPASGEASGASRSTAGVSVSTSTARKGASSMKTITEQISSFEATRQAKSARMTEIMSASGEAGTTLDQAQAEEYDGLEAEVKSIDAHLKRLADLEAANKAAAKAVTATDPVSGAQSRDPHRPVITVRQNREPGIGFSRLAICKMASFLSRGEMSASEVAKQRFPDDAEVHMALKAAVGAGTTLDANYATQLAYAQNLSSEFIEWLRPQTVIGRIPGLRRVPFNIRVASQTSGGSGYWVGQGKPKPLTKFNFDQVTLGIAKIAAIAVVADELARFSSPSAEAIVRDNLGAVVIERMDLDFIDPSKAAVSNVSPASITNGLTPMTSAGTSADNVRTDVGKLLKTFLDDNMNPTGAVIVMPNSLCLALSLMVNSLGQPEFPGMSINGGTLQGLPVVASQQAALTGGGRGNLVIALNAPDILLADDGQVTVDVSREASLEMLDSALQQDGTAGTGASLVSLWQNNLLGLRAERYINWTKARTGAVVYMDDVNWGSIGSPA